MSVEFECPVCQRRWESREPEGGPCPFCQAVVADRHAVTTESGDLPVAPTGIHEGPPSPKVVHDDYHYVRPLEGWVWASFACAFLALSGFVDLAQMFAELEKAAALEHVEFVPGRFLQAQHVANLLGFAAIALFFVTVSLVFAWYGAAHRNLRTLEVTGMDYPPSVLAGGIVRPWSLVLLPYRAVQELWLASNPVLKRDPIAWKARAGSWLVRVWWLVFLGRHVRISISVQPFPPGRIVLELMQWSAWVSAGACFLGFVAAMLFIGIILQVEHRQNRRFQRLEAW